MEEKESAQGLSVSVSAYEVAEVPEVRIGSIDTLANKWLGIATAHYYDEHFVRPPLDRLGTVLAGECARTVTARVFAPTQLGAFELAMTAVLEQLRWRRASEKKDGEKPAGK